MGRVHPDILDRGESIADRVLVLVRELERRRVHGRIVDQLVGVGTGVGANLFEADEAMSSKDWIKCVSIAAKELSETRYWLRRIQRQQWVAPQRLSPLQAECDSFQKVLGTMLVRAKRRQRTPKPSSG
jgi:four helix bundle protein